jgi:hypothetical protein
MGKKSQIALEYLIVVALAVSILTPILLYANQTLQTQRENNELILARNSVNKIGQTVDWVFSQGFPAKAEIEIYVPRGVEEINISGKTILFRVKTSAGVSDIYYFTLANVTGNISPIPGYTKVNVEALENEIRVSE